MSARLDRYYGRLRRPPGTPPTSRRKPVIGRDHSGDNSQAAGPGRASPVPAATFSTFRAPYAGRFIGAAIQALHPFHGLRRDIRGSAPPLSARRRAYNDAAGFASRYGPPSCSPQRGFRRWASTRPVSRPSRQPATGPPGSYPDGTHTRWRRRAYVGSATQLAPPTLDAHCGSSKAVAPDLPAATPARA